MSFYFWVCASLVYFLGAFGYLLYSFHGSSTDSNLKVRKLLVQKLIGYPIIIVICWTIVMLYDFFSNTDPGETITKNYEYGIVATVLPTIQGLMTGTLFLFQYIKKKMATVLSLQNTVAISPKPRNVANGNGLPAVKVLELGLVKENFAQMPIIDNQENIGAPSFTITDKYTKHGAHNFENVVKVSPTADKSKESNEMSLDRIKVDNESNRSEHFVLARSKPDSFSLIQADVIIAADESGQRKHFNSLESAIPKRQFRPDILGAGISSRATQYIEFGELRDDHLDFSPESC
jgi:hypothetical protein